MRTVIVSGGATGIGRAVAEAFVAVGDRVVITGRRAPLLHETAAAVGAEPVAFDAADPEQVIAALSGLPERVDVVVNNAGGNTDFDRPTPSGLAEVAAGWRANLDADLLTAVLLTEALLDRMGRGGAIVNIGSIATDRGAGAYGAAKAGLASWNVDLARRVGPRGITASVLAPGYVEATEFFRDRLSDERRAGLLAAAPTGRATRPAEIADAVVFLAGARQLTGQVVSVNGGEHMSR